MTNLTDSGVLLRMAYRAMQNAGIDADQVLAKVGMDKTVLSQPELRTPHDAQEWFWQAVEEVSGDPLVGLHLGTHFPIFKGQVLEYLFLSSPTFGEGLKRAIAYQRLLSDAASGELIDHEGEQIFLKQVVWSRKLVHLNECASVGIVKFFSFVTDGAFIPIEVHFTHECGQNDPREHERVFGCSVRFGMPTGGILFNRTVMDLPSAHHEPELLQLHERLASEQIARLEKQDLVTRVSRLIAELLESGNANLEEVAVRLGIKPRQLRTRLADAGTNFNQLVAEYRCKLAKRLLAGTEETIDEIVYLTGFSEPSTFYRAFKRWVGMTPIEYRKLKAAEDSASKTG